MPTHCLNNSRSISCAGAQCFIQGHSPTHLSLHCVPHSSLKCPNLALVNYGQVNSWLIWIGQVASHFGPNRNTSNGVFFNNLLKSLEFSANITMSLTFLVYSDYYMDS